MTMPQGEHSEGGASGLSVTQKVLAELRHDIVTARLAPGQIIREAEIAERMFVSKTPVREALQFLLAEGFVQVFPRRGYMVTPVSLTDIRNIMNLRLYIEPPLTAVAAKRRSEQLLERLRECLAIQLDESLSDDLRLDAASDFHRSIMSVARNERAEKLLRTYYDETTRIHYLFEEASAHVTSQEELIAHRQILEAIENGDAEAAENGMREHLIESNTALLKSFQ